MSEVDTRMPTQLPNGDIYLGPKPGGRPDNISAPSSADPKAGNAGEAALEKVLKEATHQPQQARVECPWCGQISEGSEMFKTHIKVQHAKEMASSAEGKRTEEQEAMEYAMEAKARRAIKAREKKAKVKASKATVKA